MLYKQESNLPLIEFLSSGLSPLISRKNYNVLQTKKLKQGSNVSTVKREIFGIIRPPRHCQSLLLKQEKKMKEKSSWYYL